MFWKVCAIGGLLANAALGAAFSVNVGQNADPECSLAQCAGIGAETIVSTVANATVGLGGGNQGSGDGEAPAFESGLNASLSALADLGVQFGDLLGIGANAGINVDGGETSTFKLGADVNADAGLDLGLDGDGSGGCIGSLLTGLFGSLLGTASCN